MRLLPGLVCLVACGDAADPTPSDSTGTTSSPTTPERVSHDDIGGVACLFGTEPATPETYNVTTQLSEGATAVVMVVTGDCAPQGGCNTDIDVGCAASVDGDRVVVDAWSAYTPVPSASCPSSCAQMWMTCDVNGVLPASPLSIAYEAYPEVEVTLPHDGLLPCAGIL